MTDYGALLKKALREIQSLKARLAEGARSREPVAIIGMACRFPGGANNPGAYWKLLQRGTDAITEVPRTRWDVDALYDADPDAPGRMYTRHGGFLDGIEDFDAQFFGISPLDALNMDPQQRLLLEVAWEAFEHAGQVAGAVPRTGVYVGSFMDDYLQQNFHAADLRAIDAYNTLGLLRSLAAGRLAYVLDLHGPAMQLDTACSSSLLAAHLAVQGLRNGECDLALAGGVNLILAPEVTIGLCRMKAMAADGRCKTFDARADGYVRGEGCGIVVLKRLSDAIADGDAVHAIIRGSAVNHDGRSNGLTAPNGTAQKTVIREALANAGVDPRQITLIEAHGTGTSLGDPIEAIALGEVLCQQRDAPLLVGSVKSNFGHLESAAGAAALMKVALSLEHGFIPPSLHFEEPNPHIPWDRVKLAVPTQLTRWDGPRIAGISSFGMSGTNVHMVVEAAEGGRATEGTGPYVLTLSAASDDALDALAKKYADFLSTTDASPADIAYTSNRGRKHFEHRLAVTGDTKELIAQLKERHGSRARKRPRIAFLFAGQGSGLTQSQLYAMQVELAQRWLSWGIRPDAILGHSVGEYAAACLAGVFSTDDGAKLIAERERLMNALPERGTMAAIFAPEERVVAAIRPYGDSLSIAALNGAHVVISGVTECVHAVAAQFKARPLTVSNAFHSRLMEPMLDAFERTVARTPLRPPTLRFVSTLTGKLAGEELTAASYWRQHIRQPVRFAAAVRELHCDVLVEIGPAETLIRMASHLLDDVTVLPGKFESLAALYELGVEIDWPRGGAKVALPTYPFQRQRFWIDAKPRREAQASPLAMKLTADSPPYLRDHALDGLLVVPAAAYLTMTLESVQDLGMPVALRDVTFPEALRFPLDGSRRLRLTASASQFRFASLRDDAKPFAETSWTTHCSGSFDNAQPRAAVDLADLQARLHEEQERNADAGFDIGPSFHWTKSVRIAANEALCRMEPPLATHDLHPGLLDSCFRTLGLFADGDAVYAPFHVEALHVLGRAGGPMWCHTQLSEATAEHLAGNVRLLDEHGAVLIDIVGLEARALRKRDPLYAIEWQRLDTPANASDGITYVCEGDPEQVAADLLGIVKAHDASGTPANVTVVTRGAQAVHPGDHLDPAHAWVWGFSKVVSMEYPQWRWTCADVDATSEPGTIANEPQLVIRDGIAYAPRVVRTSIEATARPFSPESTYLITGAFGAVGRQVTQWMRTNGAKKLLLAGRRTDAVEGAVSLDLADAGAVARLFHDHGPIHGIIHAAGVVDDALLRDLTWEHFARVFAAKVQGTWNLHVQSLPLDLEFFVCFSSAASLIGSKGQANYAAANAYMDALMHYRRRLGHPGLSINWGPWAGDGMAAQTQDHLRALGFDALPPATALELLGRLLRSDAAQIGVIPGPWQQQSERSAERVAIPRDRTALEAHIHRLIVSTMGRDPFAGDGHDLSFFELGMDSLMSLDLRNRLQTDLERPLPSTIALEYPTIPELAGYLLSL
jgi:acyl transferase domain-containing protein/NAD(P)-dependent dehydrogenase (short-subunit alcohol dehydrogenase family)